MLLQITTDLLRHMQHVLIWIGMQLCFDWMSRTVLVDTMGRMQGSAGLDMQVLLILVSTQNSVFCSWIQWLYIVPDTGILTY
jgi:hypothetical protein